MAPQKRAVGQDDRIPQARIVAHVTVRHQKIIGTNYRVFAQAVGAMHRHVFAKSVAIANPQLCRFARILQILRRIPDDAAGMKLIPGSDGCVTGQMNVRTDPTISSDHDAFADDGVGAYLHGWVELSGGMNDGGGMDHEPKTGRSNYKIHNAAKRQPNPKSEYRNPKQIRMRKTRNSKSPAVQVWRI
jgi:hypothetical protein